MTRLVQTGERGIRIRSQQTSWLAFIGSLLADARVWLATLFAGLASSSVVAKFGRHMIGCTVVDDRSCICTDAILLLVKWEQDRVMLCCSCEIKAICIHYLLECCSQKCIMRKNQSQRTFIGTSHQTLQATSVGHHPQTGAVIGTSFPEMAWLVRDVQDLLHAEQTSPRNAIWFLVPINAMEFIGPSFQEMQHLCILVARKILYKSLLFTTQAAPCWNEIQFGRQMEDYWGATVRSQECHSSSANGWDVSFGIQHPFFLECRL